MPNTILPRGPAGAIRTTQTQPEPQPNKPVAAPPDTFETKPANAALDPAAMHELFGNVVDTGGLDQLSGRALLDELRKRFFAKHVTLDYGEARLRMFTKVDNEGGAVRDVYTDRVLEHVTHIPSADGSESFNTEHTWPQSELKHTGHPDAVSDLHHLFPVDTHANGERANYPFGLVEKVEWQEKGAKLGRDASGALVFEPPPNHRGDVARAIFWISMAYNLPVPDAEERVLKEWANEDAVDSHERDRNVRVQKEQGDLNPFVLAPQLIAKVDDF